VDEATRVEPVELGLGTRSALRLKHAWRLGREVWHLAVQQRIWWLPALVVIVAVIAVVATTTTTTLPYAVYTLF
jgi:hypothetical protein